MAERSLPDVRQHQDNVFPRRIHADSRRAVEIEGYARDDDAGESQSPVTPNPQSLATPPCFQISKKRNPREPSIALERGRANGAG